VVLKNNLAKPSRDHCQNHKSQKHSLYRVLKENWFSTLIVATLEHGLTVLTFVTVVT